MVSRYPGRDGRGGPQVVELTLHYTYPLQAPDSL